MSLLQKLVDERSEQIMHVLLASKITGDPISAVALLQLGLSACATHKLPPSVAHDTVDKIYARELELGQAAAAK